MKKTIFFVFILFNILMTNISDAQTDKEDMMNSLIGLNSISVTVGGEFVANGTFSALATERVDQFITRTFNEVKAVMLSSTKDRQTFIEVQDNLEEYAKRGIILRRADGTEMILDLQKFRLTADFSNNPYLENGDVLIFPPVDWERNFIEVEGAISKPVVFQFVDGDKLSDAILFGRGISEAYENVTGARITRLSYDGNNEEIIDVPVKADFDLKRGDRIRILADETQRRDFKVLVNGEVNKPGYIFITKDKTTIKEVIEKAGGFTENADLTKSELIRNSQNKNQNKNNPYKDRRRPFDLLAFSRQADLLMMQRMSDIQVEDSLIFLSDNELRFARANVAIDFNKVFDDNSTNSKFIVKDGDLINIPEKQDLVYVFGQVMQPGYTDFEPNQDYNYYLQKAGGIGKLAKSEVYLIKAKTRSWIDMTDEDNYKIEAGDYIWVPKDVPRNFDYYLIRTSQIASVIGAVATVVLLFTK